MTNRLDVRSASLVFAGIIVGALVVPPAAAHISDSVSHLWGDHIKEKTDAAYTGETKVVVGRKVKAEAGTFGGHSVFCPRGYEAIGGGVEPENVLTGVVTGSAPVWGEPGNPISLGMKPKGTYRSAPGWAGFIRNNSGDDMFLKVAAICAEK